MKNVNDEFAGLHRKYQTIVIDHPEVTRYIERPDLRSTRILSHTRGRDCLMLELWNSYWRLNLGPSAWVQSETYNTTRGTCRIPQLCGLESLSSNTTAVPGFYNFEHFQHRYKYFICSVLLHVFIVRYIYIVFQFAF